MLKKSQSPPRVIKPEALGEAGLAFIPVPVPLNAAQMEACLTRAHRPARDPIR